MWDCPDVEAWVRLGAYVVATRTRKGFRTRAAFARATRLSVRTLGAIERGDKTSYDPHTLATVEHALGWVPGSSENVLRGGEPIEGDATDDGDFATVLQVWPQLPMPARRFVAHMIDEVAQLTREAKPR